MTGELKYAERVKATLMNQMQARRPVGGGASNGGSLMRRDPVWNAGLNSGNAPRSFGIAYDTIYDMLTPDERKPLSHNLAENGLPSNSLRGLLFASTQAEIAAIASAPDLPTATLYGDIGWTIMRDSCENGQGR